MKTVDVILSDVFPKYSGDLDKDFFKLRDLNRMAMKICDKNLKIGGTMVMKSLLGTYEHEFFEELKDWFKDF